LRYAITRATRFISTKSFFCGFARNRFYSPPASANALPIFFLRILGCSDARPFRSRERPGSCCAQHAVVQSIVGEFRVGDNRYKSNALCDDKKYGQSCSNDFRGIDTRHRLQFEWVDGPLFDFRRYIRCPVGQICAHKYGLVLRLHLVYRQLHNRQHSISGERNGREASECNWNRISDSVERGLWYSGDRHDEFADRSIEECGEHQFDDFECCGKRHRIQD